MRRIHLWCQSFEANPGGIQTFTSFVVRALEELYPDAEICVFAKNDEGAINGTVASATVPRNGARSPRRMIGFGRWPEPLRAFAFAVGVIWRAAWIRQLP